MRSTRVLVLDTASSYLKLTSEASGIEIVVTQLPHEDIWSEVLNFGNGGYRVSTRAQALAEAATPDDYDFVIIGNNMGKGFVFVHFICEELKSKTLIVWNSNSSRSEIPDYERFGFTHFASRPEQGEWILQQLGLKDAV